jgi:fructoselysine 6-phosphate deglycase
MFESQQTGIYQLTEAPVVSDAPLKALAEDGAEMATDVDKDVIVKSHATVLSVLDEAARLGRELAPKIDRIFFVGCGGPNRTMLAVQYWIAHYSTEREVRRFYPAEFLAQNQPRLNERTLVVLGSKSGTTPETVAAAEFLQDKPCITIGITELAEKPLAQAVQTPLLMGEKAPTAAMFMIVAALAGGLLAAKDNWPLQDKLMSSLRALPQVMADTAEIGDRRAVEDARLLKDDRILYHIASGPTFSTAYVFGVCVLMEMQWMHSTALEAAEFFHGPFEIVDQNLPLVLSKTEDPSRPLMDRVERFCKKYTERTFIYDTKDYEMEGVAPEIRGWVGPFVLQAVVRRIAERLSVWHNMPLSTRRDMWKTEY